MSKKLDNILDGKPTKIEGQHNEVDADEKVVDNGNKTQIEPTKAENDQPDKEIKTHDANGKLILTNDHLHNMGYNLHGTMAAVAEMQKHLAAVIKHVNVHTAQTQLHEKVLHKIIKGG